jgi:hypothetical protein
MTAPVPDPAPATGPGRATSGRAKWAPYRSYTEYRAAQYLGPDAEYEPGRVKLADGAWYTPDFVIRAKAGGPDVAYEVKNLRHDCRGSLDTQRRVLRVAAEKLARWGIMLRLLILDGDVWREEDV